MNPRAGIGLWVLLRACWKTFSETHGGKYYFMHMVRGWRGQPVRAPGESVNDSDQLCVFVDNDKHTLWSLRM